jgi:hypothetical protein
MAIKVKTQRGRRIRQKQAFTNRASIAHTAGEGKTRRQQTDTLLVKTAGQSPAPTLYADNVDIEWDTPVLNIPPLEEELLVARVIDAAPRPMMAIDPLWLE